MSDGAKAFIQRWLVTTLGVLVAAGILDGIEATGSVPLLTASLVLGILNAFLRPILMIVALPLLILTLGLFTFVINAVLLYFVGSVVKGFYVEDFWSALGGSILISIVSVLANLMVGKKEARIETRRTRPPERRPPTDTGSGPIIDV